ncbi:MAG: aminopeptidase [Bacilli bacterium]|nr:aminopeptidase [Bacilli bacterium]
MNREEMIQEYARNIVEIGLAIKEGELLHINCPVCAYEFARVVAKIAYDRGAKRVHISYRDDYVNREFYLHADIDNVKTFYEYEIEEAKYLVSEKAALLSIVSPIPKIMEGIDPKKMQERNRASNEKFNFYREYSMSNKGKWCVVAFPNQLWADQVFDNKENSYDLLFDAIIKACRIGEDKNELMDHMRELETHKDILNDLNLKSLIFKNSLGTDLKVDLVDDHIWGGGGEFSQSGEYFLPNIPTEEVFTMPHSHGVNGRVYSTKPLNYQGKIINDFYLDFKDGAVVSYHAEENEDMLKSMLESDEGSTRLGEVALISYDSPISNMNVLFYNTLFDENASCHLALGNAYTMNIQNGYEMNLDELKEKGYNSSMIHVDFMFGSKDMNITGITKDGKEIKIFKNGNFVI